MFNNAKNKAAALLLVALATVAPQAFAQSGGASITMPDVSSVITAITGAVTVVSSIGLAVLSLVVVVKMFGWIRGALR